MSRHNSAILTTLKHVFRVDCIDRPNSPLRRRSRVHQFLWPRHTKELCGHQKAQLSLFMLMLILILKNIYVITLYLIFNLFRSLHIGFTTTMHTSTNPTNAHQHQPNQSTSATPQLMLLHKFSFYFFFSRLLPVKENFLMRPIFKVSMWRC